MHCAQNQESLDTILCYQALGVSISDSPQRIDEMYERLVRGCKAEFKSEDSGVRESAREQLLALERMYDTIKASVSYASGAREQRKASSGVSKEPKAAVRHIGCQLTTCPSCNAQISKGMQSCPFCKASFLTKWQKFRRKYFTVTKLF